MSHHRRYYGNLLSHIDNEEAAQMLPSNVKITNNSPEMPLEDEWQDDVDLRCYYKPMNLPDYFEIDDESRGNVCYGTANKFCQECSNRSQIGVNSVLTTHKYTQPKGSIELAGKTYKIYSSSTNQIHDMKYESAVKISSQTQINPNTVDSGTLTSKGIYYDKHADDNYPRLSILGVKCEIDLLKR